MQEEEPGEGRAGEHTVVLESCFWGGGWWVGGIRPGGSLSFSLSLSSVRVVVVNTSSGCTTFTHHTPL